MSKGLFESFCALASTAISQDVRFAPAEPKDSAAAAAIKTSISLDPGAPGLTR